MIKKLILLFLLSVIACTGMTDPKGNVAVTSVSLDRQSLEMVEGDDVTLVAIVLPENAGNRAVTWKSSDAKVAYVTSGGKVTALKEGSAIEIEKSDYKSLTIYLNDRMVDLDKPVKVVYGGREIFKGMVERNEETLRSTMAERNDPGYVFCSKLTVHLNV